MKKIIAIGDIHGEVYKLKTLFAKISIKEDDTVIFLGDYIDRGRYSKQVIDFIIDLKTKCNVITLEGNHEMMAKEARDVRDVNMYLSWGRNGGGECLSSYGEQHVNQLHQMFLEHGDFFDNLKLCHETENHIFAHGYVDSDKDCEDQERWPCLWNRFDDILPHKSGKTVVVGHTTQMAGHTNKGYKVCIDTGSFHRGGYITAMIIEGDKEYFQDSRKAN
jgi:serine/threonine protein phosphatase 1|tara:strand:+ start:667 stop:1323 length:657 start_codon:yes stop_codon:yes gene_type:complete